MVLISNIEEDENSGIRTAELGAKEKSRKKGADTNHPFPISISNFQFQISHFPYFPGNKATHAFSAAARSVFSHSLKTSVAVAVRLLKFPSLDANSHAFTGS
jgi:hypothetical protein